MTTTQILIAAIPVGWFVLALLVALLIGGTIREADRREQPTDEDIANEMPDDPRDID